MATQITWLGHNCWSIETAGSTILLDPFLNDSPTAPLKADAVKADFILLSHGHDDHLGDTRGHCQAHRRHRAREF